MQTTQFSEGWQFRQTDDAGDGDEEWMPVARVPTNVHLDLMDNGKIEDPFIGFNELSCQWVGEQSWTYRLEFATPPPSSSSNGSSNGNGKHKAKERHILVLDGLDTYATARLNNTEILRSDNMFVSHRVDVTSLLHRPNNENRTEKKKRMNVLELTFLPALRESQRIKSQYPEHKWVGFNADMARLAARKAQYHYGWDWGPVLLTCGPWRGVRLESFTARVADLRVEYEVQLNDQSSRGHKEMGVGMGTVSGTIRADVEGDLRGHEGELQVVLEARLKGEKVFSEQVGVSNVEFGTSRDSDVDTSTVEVEFRVANAKLWWPYGYGEQSLYDISSTLLSRDGTELDCVTKRTGFRKGELIQEPDKSGKSFYFRFNGVDIFCGGSDWIPADSFTPRISAERYRRWLETMIEGNQVMVRVWGGGIWEEDVFYDLCDELGILVWQDFMFACGSYPTHSAFLKSVAEEGIYQTKRLRHHPSMAIYAGNNEDYQVQEQFKLTYDYADKDPESWLKTDFPARYIYEKLLPDIVAEHSPHIPYHPSSPWGDGKRTMDRTVGDLHQWNVWHGKQKKYQIFDKLGGRFNSEFGLEAFPHLQTIKSFVTDPAAQLYPQSHMLDFHNKADGHERRIATYLVENFRSRTEMGAFIHLTQLSQSEALMFAYRGWRRQWGHSNRHCGGALVWQLNDCWPVTSWAIIDYYLRKKPAYYALKRVLAPIAVGVQRAHHDWSVVHAHPAKTSTYECWVVSSKLKPVVSATVQLRFVSIATGRDIKAPVVKRDVRIVPNGSTDILDGVIDNEKEEPHVLAARVWIDGELVARDTDWPQPLKYLDLSNRGVEVKQRGSKIHVTVAKPTKGLVFEERDGVKLSDNGLDVVPGDEQCVDVAAGGECGDGELKFTYLDAPPELRNRARM